MIHLARCVVISPLASIMVSLLVMAALDSSNDLLGGGRSTPANPGKVAGARLTRLAGTSVEVAALEDALRLA